MLKRNHNSPFSIIKISIYIFALSLLISCHKQEHNKNVFHYNESSGIASLDPAFAKSQSVMWIDHQLYNTLVEIDDNLNMVPSLARSWDISDDNLIFTFHLRNNVFFHDDPAFPNGKGRLMTAKDVEYSFKRIIDRSVASSGAWIFNDKIDSTQGFKAIDDTTFQLKFGKAIQSYSRNFKYAILLYCST
jgi:ABC-type dipeptide transport system, periplasmic component